MSGRKPLSRRSCFVSCVNARACARVLPFQPLECELIAWRVISADYWWYHNPPLQMGMTVMPYGGDVDRSTDGRAAHRAEGASKRPHLPCHMSAGSTL